MVTEKSLTPSSTSWTAFLRAEEQLAPSTRSRQQTFRLAKKLLRQRPLPNELAKVRVAVLGGTTTNFLAAPLSAALLARRIAPEFHEAPYNQILPELLEEHSGTAQFAPDVALILNHRSNIPFWPDAGQSHEECELLAARVVEHFLAPIKLFRERTGSEVILQTFDPPPHRSLGHLSAKTPSAPGTFVALVNAKLAQRAPEYVHLHDVSTTASFHGLRSFTDLRYFYHAKQAVAFEGLPHYATGLAAIIAALRGHTRKVLVLDLDNTLWGGVIGEDGLSGIELGEGSGTGEAYKAFQTYVRELRARGILLAICSKNEEANARAGINHPEMVLGESDFVAMRANWTPKSENLRSMARELDLGLDAFVFLDDQPAEREEVRRALPQVAVPELPTDPALYISALDRLQLFETIALSDEDRRRTASYKSRAAAQELRESSTDLPGYLRSLEMEADLAPFQSADLERVTQLINKTNQFNTTTERLSRTQVEELASNQNVLTLRVRLADRFGDQGLISVVYAHWEEHTLSIDGWLMSCRVLGRSVEHLVLWYLVNEATKRKALALRGRFRATGRNDLVRDLYERLGFQLVSEDAHETHWRLALEAYEPQPCYVQTKFDDRNRSSLEPAH